MNTEMTLEEMQKMIGELPPFMMKKLTSMLMEYKKDKDEEEKNVFTECPKCKKEKPYLVKRGKTVGGKQIYQCKQCGSRFVVDYNEVTFHSRLSREQWNEAIKSSVTGDSLDVTAEKCDVSHRTAFNMRHKIMSFLEKNEDSIEVADEVELDEKYVQESHKGKKIEGKPGRHRGESASKRGIFDEKV